MKQLNWMRKLALSALATVMVAPMAWAEPLVIRVGSYEPESHYLVQYVYIPYLEEIERRTNGELKFQWFHGGTLVKAPQTVEALKSGLVDLTVTTGIFTQESLFPATHAMTLPFQFDSTVQANHVFQKAYHTIPEIQAEFEGLVPLGFHVSDFFNLHLHKDTKPVQTLEDVKGLEIGSMSKSAIELTEMLGGTPRNVKLEDLYVSLQRGAIDGIWFPTAPLINWKLTDFSSNHTLAYGPFVMIPMTMSEQTWNKLTPEQQQVFRDMENDLTNFTGAIVDNRRGATVRKVTERGDAISVIAGEERDKWVEATSPAYDAWLAKMEEKGIDGNAILAKITEYASEFQGMDYTSADWWGDDWQE